MWQKYSFMWCWYILPNVILEFSNVREKKKGIIECNKSTVTCDVSTNITCDDGAAKCGKKKLKYHRIWEK